MSDVMTIPAPRDLPPGDEPRWEVASREGPRDTIDSVVVALILAFVFRAFIIEAFIIPTGSMAPTLYGAHATLVCPDCGTEFAYGLFEMAERKLNQDRGIRGVDNSTAARCPNCDYLVTELPAVDYGPAQQAPESGDRILVLKWPFDIGGALGPQRWDVIVFKDPADGVTNFIKRLVGLPGEVLMILEGDVYTVPTAQLSEQTRRELEEMTRIKSELGLRIRHDKLPRVSDDVLSELAQKLRIASKTEMAQTALWQLVYNHDYPPGAAEPGPRPRKPAWVPGRGEASGWDATGRRVTFADRGEAADYIELAGKPILASCAYNMTTNRHAPDDDVDQMNPATDLRVRFVVESGDAAGRVLVRLQKLDRIFWGVVYADGRAAILESAEPPAEGADPLAAGLTEPLEPGRPMAVSFEHVDYGLVLRVGDDFALTTSREVGEPGYYGPDPALLMNPARVHDILRRTAPPQGGAVPPRIYAAGGAFDLTHLVIERDDYYFPGDLGQGLPWAGRRAWGRYDQPMLLRDGEYFMLGDNSNASKDSRLWDVVGKHLRDRPGYQLGTVPEDQLIGKAFFVYWPSGVRIGWIPQLKDVGLIPNVGRMRWIR
jgi:signal peptidase I